MHGVRLLLLSFAGWIVVASASPAPPSLVWTGDPIINPATLYVDGIGGASGFSTDTGMQVLAGCTGIGDFCGLGFTLSRAFTVTSPGTFVLTSSVENDAEASNCLPFPGCSSEADLSDSVSSFVGVLGMGLGYSPSGSAGPVYAEPIYSDGSSDYNPAEVFLNVNNSQFTILTLGLGDYTLEEDYFGIAQGTGETNISVDGRFSLVPTPEPRGGIAFMIVSFSIALCLIVRSKRDKLLRAAF